MSDSQAYIYKKFLLGCTEDRADKLVGSKLRICLFSLLMKAGDPMAKDGFQYFHRPDKEKKAAVALEYEPTDQAPKVVASGQGYVAEKIIQTAREADIPIHKDEKLAGSLREIEIGEYIPPELYQVVADVLVFVDAMDNIKAKVMDHPEKRVREQLNKRGRNA